MFWSRIKSLGTSKKTQPKTHLALETLEDRLVPAGTMAAPAFNISLPWTFSTVYSPTQIRTAYGFNRVNLNGAGQTIAIVDAFDAPNMRSDLAAFDRDTGIADPPQFSIFKEHDNIAFVPDSDTSPTNGASPRYDENWEVEMCLDVEWAHAMAPGANIILVEALDNSTVNLFRAVDFARNQAGVTVVSMSWGSGEFGSEASNDNLFTTPQGHVPVTFIASTGDTGGQRLYPAVSPNVLAVGGTTLNLNDDMSYQSETAWSDGGGGVSDVEPRPAYQNHVHTYANRTVPDVAYDADPGTGFEVYCHSKDGFLSSPWVIQGGTSAGAPQWAAIIALANQSRANAGKPALAHAVQDMYSISTHSFHDVQDGNNTHWAHQGYDLATGLGTPRVNRLVTALTKVERVFHIVGHLPITKVLGQLLPPVTTPPVFSLPPGSLVGAIGPVQSVQHLTVDAQATDGAAPDVVTVLAKVRVKAQAPSDAAGATDVLADWSK
jgi:subtilase family serine protease